MTNQIDPQYAENGETMPILRLPVGKQLDPLKYRRKAYVMNVSVAAVLGGTGRGSIAIDDLPFMWTKTACGILEYGSNLAQDMNFQVQLRDSNRFYQSDFARPDLLFGNSPMGGPLIPHDVDTFLDSNATITAEVINNLNRVGTDFFVVQFVFHGFERWQR